MIKQNILEKGVKFRVNNMKNSLLSKDTYNKKSISINAKLRHYSTVVQSDALYGAEYLNLNKKMMLENLAIA